MDDNDDHEELLSCDRCDKMFHIFCVEISSETFAVIQNCKNLTWTCDDCVGAPVTQTGSNIMGKIMKKLEKLDAMASDIEELKAKGATVKKPLLSDLFQHTPRGSKRTGTHEETPTIKKKRLEQKTATPAPVIGTGAANNELVAVKPSKWLYVSMLHPDTTEASVVKLLASGLKSDAGVFNCVKLLPKNLQYAPSFISFKIGMPEELLSKSMEPSLWPTGVAVREFVNRPRKFFRPTGAVIPQ